MIIENKQFLVDFSGGIIAVSEYFGPPAADGLLENQSLFEGYCQLEIIDQVMLSVCRNYEHGEYLKMMFQMISKMKINSVSQN